MNIASQHGFTLIELIVVIVILAIVSAISLPSFQSIIVSNRMTTEINTLVADLHFAKTEAIKRSKTITVCSANQGLDACNELQGKSDWGVNGWLVMDGEQVIRVADAISSSDVLSEMALANGSDEGKVSFNRYGFTAGSARSFVLCGPFGNEGVIKGAVITTAGRIRNAADTDNNGKVEYVELLDSENDESNLTSTDMVC